MGTGKDARYKWKSFTHKRNWFTCDHSDKLILSETPRQRQVASPIGIFWIFDVSFLWRTSIFSFIFISWALHMARSGEDFDKYHDKFKTVRRRFSNRNCIIIEGRRWRGERNEIEDELKEGEWKWNDDGNNCRINLTKCRPEEPGKEDVDPTCVWHRTFWAFSVFPFE